MTAPDYGTTPNQISCYTTSLDSTAIDGDWIYLYGTANHGDTLGFSVAVARVHIDHLLDPAAMQYWDGYEWSESAGSAAASRQPQFWARPPSNPP